MEVIMIAIIKMEYVMLRCLMFVEIFGNQIIKVDKFALKLS